MALWPQNDKGGISLEFSILAAPLIFVVLSTLQLGQVLATKSELTLSNSKAVRMLQVNPSLTPAEMVDAMSARFTFIDPDSLTVTYQGVTISGQPMRMITWSYNHTGIGFPLPLGDISMEEKGFAP